MDGAGWAAIIVAVVSAAGVIVSAVVQGRNTKDAAKREQEARADEREAETARRNAEREAEEARLKLQHDADAARESREAAAALDAARKQIAADFLIAARHCILLLRRSLGSSGYAPLPIAAFDQLSQALGRVEAHLHPDAAQIAVEVVTHVSDADINRGNESLLRSAEASLDHFNDVARRPNPSD